MSLGASKGTSRASNMRHRAQTALRFSGLSQTLHGTGKFTYIAVVSGGNVDIYYMPVPWECSGCRGCIGCPDTAAIFPESQQEVLRWPLCF